MSKTVAITGENRGIAGTIESLTMADVSTWFTYDGKRRTEW